MNIALNSLPLGGEDWQSGDRDMDRKVQDDLEYEITLCNPGVRLMDRPPLIKSRRAVKAEDKKKSSMILLVESTQQIRREVAKQNPELALYRLRGTFRKYIRRTTGASIAHKTTIPKTTNAHRPNPQQRKVLPHKNKGKVTSPSLQ
ncbi:hypothetical protein C7212DRAFT_347350 [Tuber magnatum]|uniref:Uncharacterized protein n=1 Tax=Tuber magnatum TaxID=42249 RepID=A0A317SHH6_9PEZI|nr:hypothetical protein C7212DRAFT_347350 [Tuber magnatum]